MEYQIIHADPNILVIDKPAGVPVLPEGWQKDAPYLVNELERKFDKIWVVHRLDKSTSGVMVFALTAAAHRELNRQFEFHEVDKRYHALVVGVPTWDEKIARHPLRINVGRRHRTIASNRERAASIKNRSNKPAETHFRVLKRFQSHALLEARPVTGRTHQVRVHASVLGYPILGDTLYGEKKSDLIARCALHAFSLTLQLPTEEERRCRRDEWIRVPSVWSPITFSAPYPPDFVTALKSISL